LVVEDERPVRDLLATVLRREGFTVLSAATAEEAVELEQAHPIDCLLTDVILPGMSGPDLARAIRERSPSVKVVFMSGYTGSLLTEGDMAEAEFIQKPFDARVVAQKLRALLNPAGD
jgi:two-component system cell cycle sensor histidine kinase/response regulator CckA